MCLSSLWQKPGKFMQKLCDAGISVWSAGSPIGKIDIKKDNYPRCLDLLRHTLEIAQH